MTKLLENVGFPYENLVEKKKVRLKAINKAWKTGVCKWGI